MGGSPRRKEKPRPSYETGAVAPSVEGKVVEPGFNSSALRAVIRRATRGRHRMQAPRIERVKGGWAAYGDGWAVTGSTPEEARERFDAALLRHREILARPDPLAQSPTGA